MGKRARTEYANKLVNVGEEKENYSPELEEEVDEELINEYVIDDHEYEIMDVTNEATDKQEIDQMLHVETITPDIRKVEPGPSSQTSASVTELQPSVGNNDEDKVSTVASFRFLRILFGVSESCASKYRWNYTGL
ncbi:hypothetical protein PPYR_00700 [Photinus pyralis]|uniref:Uncharacterized protein n=1 Tax=Photinus pyralis TaxID=7054 RepID=A0A5N4B2V4_PHOPY|nr:hypothetical protein PPYR_00700 [Photinus pyralis]